MPKKHAMFSSDLVPLRQPLPTSIAASVGATLARHAYLDWVLGQVMYSLMEISIRQGRVILKLPRPRQYIAAVRDLFEFHGLESEYNFEQLARRLETAAWEMTQRDWFDQVVVNDDLERAADEVAAIIEASRTGRSSDR